MKKLFFTLNNYLCRSPRGPITMRKSLFNSGKRRRQIINQSMLILPFAKVHIILTFTIRHRTNKTNFTALSLPHAETKIAVMVPVITFLYVTLSVLITSDNLLVILAVYSTRALRKVTNYSLVSLAFADLLVGMVVLPVRIIEVRAFHWSRNIHWCQFSLSLTLLSLSASVLNLLIVTIERYFAIIHSLTYTSKITPRRNFYAIILVWIVAFVMSFLPFVALKSTTAQERSSQHKVCRFADTMSPEYLTFFSATVVLIPTLFITFAYLRIYRAASRLRKRLKSLQVHRIGDENIASVLNESKAAKTIGEFP